MQGWIKLHRKIVDWEWYDDLPTFKLFIHLLILANHEDNIWHGQTVKKGSLITSIASLAQQTGLTNQNVRTCLAHLQKTGEINKQSTNKNTLIIVLNYERYQEFSIDENTKSNNQLTNSQQTTNKQANKQLTTNKNDNNIKNDKNVAEAALSYDNLGKLKELYPDVDWDSYDEQDFSLRPANFYAGQKVVFLSAVQEDFLLDALGAETTQYYVEKLADFIINKKARVKNHYATILKWHNQDTAV